MSDTDEVRMLKGEKKKLVRALRAFHFAVVDLMGDKTKNTRDLKISLFGRIIQAFIEPWMLRTDRGQSEDTDAPVRVANERLAAIEYRLNAMDDQYSDRCMLLQRDLEQELISANSLSAKLSGLEHILDELCGRVTAMDGGYGEGDEAHEGPVVGGVLKRHVTPAYELRSVGSTVCLGSLETGDVFVYSDEQVYVVIVDPTIHRTPTSRCGISEHVQCRNLNGALLWISGNRLVQPITVHLE